MHRIVVIGAGISGLAAAWTAAGRARKAGLDSEVIVLERDPRVGGKARTGTADGFLVEAGPTGFMGGDTALDQLIDEAGLAGERIPANQAAARRFVVRGGRLRELKPHPIRFLTSGVLGPLGVLRLLAEPFVARRRSEADETVWQFARRRIGSQAADRLIAPMVLGVFAGDAKRLSLPAAFPRLAALEQEHGSLVRGMIRRRRQQGGSPNGAPQGGPAGPGGGLHSFRTGMSALPVALAERGAFQVRCGVSVEAIVPDPARGWSVLCDDSHATLNADVVILAGEPFAMAELVRQPCPIVARELDAISCPPVTVVALGFDRSEATPDGFGFLVPRQEGFRILGCLYDSCLFGGRAPDGRFLVRAMLGGAVDPEAGSLPDDELVSTVRGDLERLLGLHTEPRFRQIVRWPRAIPQYELGHLERVGRIQAELDQRQGLIMAGNALHGIAFGKAATAGVKAGELAVQRLLATTARSPAGRPAR